MLTMLKLAIRQPLLQITYKSKVHLRSVYDENIYSLGFSLCFSEALKNYSNFSNKLNIFKTRKRQKKKKKLDKRVSRASQTIEVNVALTQFYLQLYSINLHYRFLLFKIAFFVKSYERETRYFVIVISSTVQFTILWNLQQSIYIYNCYDQLLPDASWLRNNWNRFFDTFEAVIWLNCLKNFYKKDDGRRKRAREREKKLRIANVIRMGRAREIERDEDQLRGTDKDGVFH